MPVCTDIEGVVYIGSTYNFQDDAFSGQTGYDPKWGTGITSTTSAATAINEAAYIFQQHSSVLTSGTESQAAALQLAVWKVLYDTGDGNYDTFTAGNFKASNSSDAAAITLATQWVDAAAAQSQQYVGFILQPTVSQTDLTPTTAVQEMLYNITPVPEPATIIAGALLLLPFGASTLRILRRKHSA